jgi:tetratricopeptide (TPR) repeat protein
MDDFDLLVNDPSEDPPDHPPSTSGLAAPPPVFFPPPIATASPTHSHSQSAAPARRKRAGAGDPGPRSKRQKRSGRDKNGLVFRALGMGQPVKGSALTPTMKRIMAEAHAHYNAHEYEEASQQVVEVLALAANMERPPCEPYVLLGLIHVELEDKATAVNLYSRALVTSGRDPQIWVTVGGLMMDLWRFEEAAEAYEMAARLDPQAAGHILLRADALCLTPKGGARATHLMKKIAGLVDDRLWRLKMARALRANGQPKFFEETVKVLEPLPLGDKDALFERLEVALTARKYDRALEMVQQSGVERLGAGVPIELDVVMAEVGARGGSPVVPRRAGTRLMAIANGYLHARTAAGKPPFPPLSLPAYKVVSLFRRAAEALRLCGENKQAVAVLRHLVKLHHIVHGDPAYPGVLLSLASGLMESADAGDLEEASHELNRLLAAAEELAFTADLGSTCQEAVAKLRDCHRRLGGGAIDEDTERTLKAKEKEVRERIEAAKEASAPAGRAVKRGHAKRAASSESSESYASSSYSSSSSDDDNAAEPAGEPTITRSPELVMRCLQLETFARSGVADGDPLRLLPALIEAAAALAHLRQRRPAFVLAKTSLFSLATTLHARGAAEVAALPSEAARAQDRALLPPSLDWSYLGLVGFPTSRLERARAHFGRCSHMAAERETLLDVLAEPALGELWEAAVTALVQANKTSEALEVASVFGSAVRWTGVPRNLTAPTQAVLGALAEGGASIQLLRRARDLIITYDDLFRHLGSAVRGDHPRAAQLALLQHVALRLPSRGKGDRGRASQSGAPPREGAPEADYHRILRSRLAAGQDAAFTSAALALAHAESGNFAVALAFLYDVARLRPDCPSVLFAIGMTYLQACLSAVRAGPARGWLDSARRGAAFLHEYCSKAGNTPLAHYNVGRAFHGLGADALALHHYEQAMQTRASPIYRLAAHNAAHIYARSGNHRAACLVLDTIVLD